MINKLRSNRVVKLCLWSNNFDLEAWHLCGLERTRFHILIFGSCFNHEPTFPKKISCFHLNSLVILGRFLMTSIAQPSKKLGKIYILRPTTRFKTYRTTPLVPWFFVLLIVNWIMSHQPPSSSKNIWKSVTE